MRLKWLLLAVVAAGAFFGGGWLLRQRRARMVAPPPGTSPATVATGRLFTNVFETVKSYAVDSLDDQALYRMAAVGVLSEVGDPYAALLPGRDSGPAERLGEPPVQGLYLDQPEGFVEVVAVVPGSPADLAGIKAGDAVLRINDTRIELQRAEQVGQLVDGKDGSTVRVRIGRDGGAGPLWVKLTRGPSPEPLGTVTTALGDGVVSLKLARVDSSAAGAVRTLVDSLVGANAKGLVLDLRGVVEGRLADAVRLVEPFLERGQSVVTNRALTPGDTVVYRDRDPATNAELAVVVLVNRATAGAAEVVAGSLQDHDRAAVVGEATFGRGSTQSLFPLGNGTTLRLTTSLWLTPSGRVIQRLLAPPLAEGSTDTTTVRPKFKTDAGRTVLGGGGIVPDREILAGKEPSQAQDLALVAARDLLSRAKNRKTLLAALDLK